MTRKSALFQRFDFTFIVDFASSQKWNFSFVGWNQDLITNRLHISKSTTQRLLWRNFVRILKLNHFRQFEAWNFILGAKSGMDQTFPSDKMCEFRKAIKMISICCLISFLRKNNVGGLCFVQFFKLSQYSAFEMYYYLNFGTRANCDEINYQNRGMNGNVVAFFEE